MAVNGGFKSELQLWIQISDNDREFKKLNSKWLIQNGGGLVLMNINGVSNKGFQNRCIGRDTLVFYSKLQDPTGFPF